MTTIDNLTAASAALADAITSATADAQTILALEAKVDDLTRQLADCAGEGQRVCVWPYGKDIDTFHALESELGVTFGGYKPRGGTGQLKGTAVAGPGGTYVVTVTGAEPILKNGADLLSRPGFLYGNQINPRVGTLTDKYPVSYAKIAAGDYDRFLIPVLADVAASGGRFVIEIPISEANVRKGVPSAQPAVPDNENFEAAFLHELSLMPINVTPVVSVGAGSILHPTPDNDARTYFTPGVVGGLKARGGYASVDAYSRKTPVTIAALLTRPAAYFEDELGLSWTLTEAGCAEQKGDGGTFKAQWLTDLGDFLKAHPRCRAVWLNHGDSSKGAYRLTTTPKAAAAAKALVERFAA